MMFGIRCHALPFRDSLPLLLVPSIFEPCISAYQSQRAASANGDLPGNGKTNALVDRITIQTHLPVATYTSFHRGIYGCHVCVRLQLPVSMQRLKKATSIVDDRES